MAPSPLPSFQVQGSLGRPILSAGRRAVQQASDRVASTAEDLRALPSRGRQKLQQTQQDALKALRLQKDELLSKVGIG